MIIENDDGSTTVFRKGRQPEVRPPESRPMTVYILWDSSAPSCHYELVDIYATQEAAEAGKLNALEKCSCWHTLSHHRDGAVGGNCYDCDCRAFRRWHDPACLEIEEREVKS